MNWPEAAGLVSFLSSIVLGLVAFVYRDTLAELRRRIQTLETRADASSLAASAATTAIEVLKANHSHLDEKIDEVLRELRHVRGLLDGRGSLHATDSEPNRRI